MSKKQKPTNPEPNNTPQPQVLNLNIIGAVITALFGGIMFFKNIVDLSLAAKLTWIALLVLALIIFTIVSGRNKFFKNIITTLLKKKLEDEKTPMSPNTPFDLIQLIQWGIIGGIALFILSIFFVMAESGITTLIATKTPTPTATATYTQTLTPTLTSTATFTSTATATFTPTLVSARSRYYMIVVDASRNMNVPFGDGTQTKWDAAQASAKQMIEAVNPLANFGLVVIGGQGEDTVSNPCDSPTAPLVPFTSPEGILLAGDGFPEKVVLAGLDQLKPSGGGAFDKAFITAKNQLENLPPNTIKSLIYITGASDTCEAGNEWENLTAILQLTDDYLSYREIIVLAEKLSPEVKNFATIIKQLKNVNVQTASNQQELDQSVAIAIQQVEVKAVEQAQRIATAQPPLIPYTPTEFPTKTRTPTPGPAPTSTSTPLPISTETNTPIPPPPATSAPPSVVLILNGYIGTGIGCQLNLTVRVGNGAVTGSFHVWNASFPPEGDVYTLDSFSIGDNSYYNVTLGGNQLEYYLHNVWFVFDGGSSNTLSGLQCPGVP